MLCLRLWPWQSVSVGRWDWVVGSNVCMCVSLCASVCGEEWEWAGGLSTEQIRWQYCYYSKRNSYSSQLSYCGSEKLSLTESGNKGGRQTGRRDACWEATVILSLVTSTGAVCLRYSNRISTHAIVLSGRDLSHTCRVQQQHYRSLVVSSRYDFWIPTSFGFSHL